MQTIPANQLLAGLTLAEPVTIRAVVTDSRKVEPGCVFCLLPPASVLTAMTTPPVPTGAAQNISLPTIPSRACLRTARSLCRTAAGP